MKNITLALAAVAAFAVTGTAQATGTTAHALATWSATAKKDASSKLIVTPLGSLTFEYAEGIKGFNSLKGLFDVTIEGEGTATDFKLTSKLVSNTLTQLDTSGSTLEVGVNYNGTAIDKIAETTLIDVNRGILGGNLGILASTYNQAGRTSAQDQFTFNIIGATADGTVAVTDFSTLPEGIWSGEVSVEFNATWTTN
ncbi:common pilus major fimbrillin subunit EcpA [Serratia silvae]|uniref:Common pilus major fimbrillin subunit EcpA n=1 Tax=Serratia silvae TaxID=2824122 RepID=A0ABT0KE60_9GAMM|nr:common pilus major fimbrillin subunit EcpA [Serratia silvae]MCL1029848.1 common pilus major fimbrillin subunit EcpA [Serratia silvae]